MGDVMRVAEDSMEIHWMGESIHVPGDPDASHGKAGPAGDDCTKILRERGPPWRGNQPQVSTNELGDGAFESTDNGEEG